MTENGTSDVNDHLVDEEAAVNLRQFLAILKEWDDRDRMLRAQKMVETG